MHRRYGASHSAHGRPLVESQPLRIAFPVPKVADHGWSSSGPSGIWSYQSLEDLAETARMVVGPDEPPEERSHEDEAAMHWAQLAANAQARGVHVEPGELAALPHDVEIGPEIRVLVAGSRQ